MTTTQVPEGLAARAARIGGPDGVLTDPQIHDFVVERLQEHPFDGRSVCVIVPDATRVCPLPQLVRAIHDGLHGRAARITVLIALGTHSPMHEEALGALLGYEPGKLQRTYPGVTVLNHEWWRPDTFADLGTIPQQRIEELSEGRIHQDVRVLLNRAVVDHDVSLVVGPALPHEVVGISGGNKYFFPGVAGQEIIDVSHWLGALITSAEIIGTTGITPVRALIDEGSALIPSEKLAIKIVTAEGGGLHSVSFGPTDAAWASAAEICAETHVTYLDAPVKRVLSLVPPMYDEIWTGAKGFYKVEPVVADGGEVILYAPHISEVARNHPEILEIGYHCRDYFVKQWERFKDVHWGTLAHSTHLRGAGRYDAATGTEELRAQVTLATGIPREVCESINLGHLDPDGIDLEAYRNDPETLVVPNAGEMLYRLRAPSS